MRFLVPEFERFYNICCNFLKKFSRDSYYEGDVGIPSRYAKVRDKGFGNKVENKKKKKRRKFRIGDYVMNKLGTISFDVHEGNNFNYDGLNSFRHKKKANVRITTRPQKFCKAPEVSTDFYYENFEVMETFDEFDLPWHVTVGGNFETNRHTIQQQIDCRNFGEGHLPNLKHYKMMEKAIRDSIRKMQIQNLGDVNISDILDFDFDLSTKPGYRFEHYFGAQDKSKCVDNAVALAEERYKRVLNATRDKRFINRKEIIPGIYTIGARNSRNDSSDIGNVAKSRAVHMPEWHTELHGGIFSDRITAHLVNKGVGPIYIGNSFIKYERLQKEMNKNYCAIEGDWSKFDASLCNVLITMSLCILRLYFPTGLLYDNHFLAILDTLIIKDYHVVGGDVLRILHGLPSGSKWTSLIGSVLNLIVLNYVFSSVKSNDRSFAIGGDDFVAFIKKDSYDLNLLQNTVESRTIHVGMTLKFYRLKSYKYSKNINDYPVFYKYTVFENKPVIPLESLITRVFSPWNKTYNSNLDVYKFLVDVLPSLAYPSTSCILFYYFYKYIYFRCFGAVIEINDIAKQHYVLYNSMMKYDISPEVLRRDHFTTKRNVFVNFCRLSDYTRKVFCLD